MFINVQAPECEARNEQTLRILVNIKPDSGTPIAGWPEAKVSKVHHMCQNKSKGLGGAISMTQFPLNTYGLSHSYTRFCCPSSTRFSSTVASYF